MLIGYARVSTDEQNLDLQLDALKEAGCTTIHRDTGISGMVKKRPGLEKAMSSLKRGDVLVVWRLDRLGRSLSHLIETINRIEAKGIHFRSLNEAIDTSSSAGRLVFHIMGAMAEFERSLISERTRAGMKVAKQRGTHIGRPRLLTETQRRQIMESVSRGCSFTTLARQYGVSVPTIRRASGRAAGPLRPNPDELGATGKLLRSTFSTESFEEWHDAVSKLYKPSLDKASSNGFRVDVDGFMLSDTLLARCSSVEQAFSRTPARIGRDGIDNYMVQVFRKGRCRAATDKGEVVMEPGDICVFDNTRTLDSFNETFDLLAFTVPREKLAPLLHDPDGVHHGRIAAGSRHAELFRSRLETVYRDAARLAPEDAADAQFELLNLLAAAVNGGHDMTLEQKKAVDRALFHKIQRYIDSNIGDPRLTAVKLAERFGLSKSRVYRLFEPHGGVASYIRQRRLSFAHATLFDPSSRRQSVRSISAAAGFISEQAFTDGFCGRFGVDPAVLRRQRMGAVDEPPDKLSWSRWLATS